MMIVPKIRGFICTTAHPYGCAINVNQQINYVKKHINPIISGEKPRVLVIGASTGYGLASRIAAGFGLGSPTIGVFWERSSCGDKTASSGWYNSAALTEAAIKSGLYAKSINGDAFSAEVKLKTIDLIKQDLTQVDLIIYSLASPRRIVDGTVYNSVLKPIGQNFTSKTVDINTGKVNTIEILPANPEEIVATIKVMGGEDLKLWIDLMHQHEVLAPKCRVLAYSYIGPEITYPVYRQGTIGAAKENLESTLNQLDNFMAENYKGSALISVNKALVTQASAAIPVVPLYISLLYKVMKTKNLHEGCIEQITRLFKNYLCISSNRENLVLDSSGRIRIDDLEMRADVQAEVNKLWELVSTDNLPELADLKGYREDFHNLFGFKVDGVDYNKDYDIDLPIPTVVEYV